MSLKRVVERYSFEIASLANTRAGDYLALLAEGVRLSSRHCAREIKRAREIKEDTISPAQAWRGQS